MSHHTASLAEVVRDALRAAGHLTDTGLLTRAAAESQPLLSRSTVSRHIATGAFTALELNCLAEILELPASELMARAEDRAA